MSVVKRFGIGFVVLAGIIAVAAAIGPSAHAGSGGTVGEVEARFAEYENLAWDHERCPSGPSIDAAPVAYVQNVLVGMDLTPAAVVQAAVDLMAMTAGPVTVQSFSYGVTAFELDPAVDAAQILATAAHNLPALHLDHVFSYDPFWRFSPFEQPTAIMDDPQGWEDPLGQTRRVVVLDTGYPATGTEGEYAIGDNTIVTVDPAQPTANHGPFIASQIAAIAPGDITLQRILTEKGLLNAPASSSTEELFDELALIETMKTADLDDAVVNMSFGTYGCEAGGIPRVLEEAILTETHDGVDFVAAAGNDETNAQRFPAAFADTVTGVTAVGAHDGHPSKPRRACFSNYGAVTTWAPGKGVLGRLPHGEPARGSGTSFAAPYVTAALSADRGVHSNDVDLHATVPDSDGGASAVGTAC